MATERYRDLNSAVPACISIIIYRLVTSLNLVLLGAPPRFHSLTMEPPLFKLCHLTGPAGDIFWPHSLQHFHCLCRVPQVLAGFIVSQNNYH